MTNLLLSKQERDKLFRRLETLENNLYVTSKTESFYRSELRNTRQRIIEIHNAIGAKSTLSRINHDETVSNSWNRCLDEILEAINEA